MRTIDIFNRANHKGYFLVYVILTAFFIGCTHKKNVDIEVRAPKDLENAITVITDRRAYELEIIKEEKYAISVLEENIKNSNSQGMKDKLRDDISFKNAVIAKAEKNIANQNEILKELNHKRDSIESLNVGHMK